MVRLGFMAVLLYPNGHYLSRRTECAFIRALLFSILILPAIISLSAITVHKNLITECCFFIAARNATKTNYRFPSSIV